MNKLPSEALTHYINEIDQAMIAFVNSNQMPDRLKKSIIYSIEAGGKRVRPILMLLTGKAFDQSIDKIIPVACAIEFIHTYSLIHDDLPAMDDDDYRRGKLTNHKAFDEATAILAGDALLTLGTEVIAKSAALSADEKVYALQRLAEVSGASGMVGGQMLDLTYENQQIPLDELERVHHLKTGQLIIYALEMGAYLAGKSSDIVNDLKAAGKAIGLTFQIQDDILDVIGDEDHIGKKTGSDELNQKSTYPKLLTLDGAVKEKTRHVEQTFKLLEKAGIASSDLALFINQLSNRDK